jgi:hypothetical protein
MAGAFPVATAVAAESVMLPNGDLLTVWQARQPTMIIEPYSPATDGSAIAYSVSGIEGSFTGTIEITADPALDAWPRLVVDPATGWPRLFWSRFDGSGIRVAYARYEEGGWTDVRYLTYAGLNSLVPRVGAGREGSYLFWASWEGGNYLYAPIDLKEGHLLSYPQGIPYYTFPRDVIQDDAATDAPVVTGDCTDGGCDSGIVDEAPDSTSTDAMDVPVVTGVTDSIWTVGGNSGCRSQIMVLPNPGQSTATVVRFTHGAVAQITLTPVPTPVPGAYGDTLARALLAATCD